MDTKKKKKLNKMLEQTYELLEGEDIYIINTKEIDELFEPIMEYFGAFDKETLTFKDGKEWSKEAHFIQETFWNWYIKIIKKKLKITKYYEKYYGKYLGDKK